MAENEDQDASKTEEPTAKRLQQAREKGQVVVSQEVKSWLMLVAGALVLMFLMPGKMRELTLWLVRYLDQADAFALGPAEMQNDLAALVLEVGWILAPILGLLMLFAIAGGIVQSGPLWAPAKIKPEWQKVSLIKGFKRLFSLRSMVEFAKGLAKLTVVAIVAVGLAVPKLKDIELIASFDLVPTLDRIQETAVALTTGTVAVMALVAALDYLYQRHTFLQQMRMTRQEVREEHKQSEGDPQIKARIRRLRIERAQKRMMAAVPKADVVITNPTHFAVALSYQMQAMNAPKLVAKGVDTLARRIREVAEEHEVPIVENPPLARALYAAVELDEEIPPEHYHAVAQVIGYVMRLKGQQSWS